MDDTILDVLVLDLDAILIMNARMNVIIAVLATSDRSMVSIDFRSLDALFPSGEDDVVDRRGWSNLTAISA